MPIRAEACRIPTECAQVTVHGLPAEFSVVGVVRTLLACAGYERNVLVRAEFAGELPAALAANHPDVVRGDVAVGVVKLPHGDPELKHLPRRCYDHGNDMSFKITVASHSGARHRGDDRSSSLAHGQTQGEGTSRPPRQSRRREAHQQRRAAAATTPSAPVSFVRARGGGGGGGVSQTSRGLQRPLHPVTDLGGQFDRRGLGRPLHPPGFPVGARFPVHGGGTAGQSPHPLARSP